MEVFEGDINNPNRFFLLMCFFGVILRANVGQFGAGSKLGPCWVIWESSSHIAQHWPSISPTDTQRNGRIMMRPFLWVSVGLMLGQCWAMWELLSQMTQHGPNLDPAPNCPTLALKITPKKHINKKNRLGLFISPSKTSMEPRNFRIEGS